MSENWCVEKTKRTDGTERLEIHLGDSIYIVSLEKGEELARGILSLLEIDIVVENEMTLHVFTDTVEYYIAKSIKQAIEMQRKYFGENPGEAEDWEQCDDDAELNIWLDDFGDLTEHGEGVLVTGTFRDWADSYKPGFLCLTEY